MDEKQSTTDEKQSAMEEKQFGITGKLCEAFLF
jgi:hypothetical protein